MGGRVCEEPKKNCIILANKKEGVKINVARMMEGIKYLVPEYVKDCKNLKTKLDWSGYELK